MRVLIATRRTNGDVANDVDYCVTGELLQIMLPDRPLLVRVRGGIRRPQLTPDDDDGGRGGGAAQPGGGTGGDPLEPECRRLVRPRGCRPGRVTGD